MFASCLFLISCIETLRSVDAEKVRPEVPFSIRVLVADRFLELRPSPLGWCTCGS